jgi:hypothetical protein
MHRTPCHSPRVPNHSIGSNHTFGNLSKAYAADPQGEGDADFLLHRGDEILALCLRARFNPKPEEVWVGDTAEVAKWGERLASLKGTKTVPVYYSPKGRTLYEFRGHYLVTGDTTAKDDLEKARGPVPISRIVYIKPVPKSAVP